MKLNLLFFPKGRAFKDFVFVVLRTKDALTYKNGHQPTRAEDTP